MPYHDRRFRAEGVVGKHPYKIVCDLAGFFRGAGEVIENEADREIASGLRVDVAGEGDNHVQSSRLADERHILQAFGKGPRSRLRERVEP